MGCHRRKVHRRPRRHLARPGRDRPFQRIGIAGRPELAAGDGLALLCQVPAPGWLPLQPVPHRGGARRTPLDGAIAGRAVRGAVRPRLRCPRPRCEGGRDRGRRGYRRADEPGHRSGTASLRVDDRGHAAHQLLRRQRRFRASTRRVVDQGQPGAHLRITPSASEIRDLRLLAPGRGRSSAIRSGRTWRAALE